MWSSRFRAKGRATVAVMEGRGENSLTWSAREDAFLPL